MTKKPRKCREIKTKNNLDSYVKQKLITSGLRSDYKARLFKPGFNITRYRYTGRSPVFTFLFLMSSLLCNPIHCFASKIKLEMGRLSISSFEKASFLSRSFIQF